MAWLALWLGLLAKASYNNGKHVSLATETYRNHPCFCCIKILINGLNNQLALPLLP
nr:hypothetical protein Q903MT_gene1904 [Picea sitchensis]